MPAKTKARKQKKLILAKSNRINQTKFQKFKELKLANTSKFKKTKKISKIKSFKTAIKGKAKKTKAFKTSEKPTKAKPLRKLKLGMFSFASCEGCFTLLLNLFNTKLPYLKSIIDFQYARLLKQKNELKGLDVALIEGSISRERNAERLKEIRKNCKKLVEFGSCAITGWPSAQRNDFTLELKQELRERIESFKQLPEIKQAHDFVKVDSQIPGCPITLEDFEKHLNKWLEEFKIVKPSKTNFSNFKKANQSEVQ